MQEETEFPVEGGEDRRPLIEIGVLQLQGQQNMVFDRDRRIGGDEESWGRGGGRGCRGGRGGRGGRHGDLGGVVLQRGGAAT